MTHPLISLTQAATAPQQPDWMPGAMSLLVLLVGGLLVCHLLYLFVIRPLVIRPQSKREGGNGRTPSEGGVLATSGVGRAGSPGEPLQAGEPLEADRLNGLASGQRMVIGAIELSVLSLVTGIAVHPTLGTAVGLAAFALGVVGIVKMLAGLGASRFTRLLLLGVWFWPTALSVLVYAGFTAFERPARVLVFANLVILLVLNARATKVLRDGGFPVGFFGVRGRD